MNVGPAQFSTAATDVRESAKQVRAPQAQRPNPGKEPVKAAAKPQEAEPVPSFAQDEVRVQWDTSAQVTIYQFVNQRSGAVVLQLPSREVLNLARGIHASLQKESPPPESLPKESSNKDLQNQESVDRESGNQESAKQESATQELGNQEIAHPAAAAARTAGHEKGKANGN